MYFLDQYNDSHASRHATVKIEKSTRLYKDLHARLWMKTLPGVCYPYPAEGPSMVLIHSSSPLGEGNRATGLYRTGNTGQHALCRTKWQEEESLPRRTPGSRAQALDEEFKPITESGIPWPERPLRPVPRPHHASGPALCRAARVPPMSRRICPTIDPAMPCAVSVHGWEKRDRVWKKNYASNRDPSICTISNEQ